jgi:ferredoxin
VLEAVFSESAFCKYVCPLGTFNFVYSTVSPLQIMARSHDVCANCAGKECVNGSYAPQPVVLIDAIGSDGQVRKSHTNGPDGTLGCGTLLFVPQIKSNMDCTLCLDCVRACPHNNVALAARKPELLRPDALPKRWDIAFLLTALAFMGVANAFGMVPPVYDLMQNIAQSLGLTALGWSNLAIEGVVLLILFSISSLLLPAVCLVVAAWLSQQLGNGKQSLREIAAAFAPAFVPIGMGIWAAHYGFHFLSGALTIIPVFQQFLAEHGAAITPDWSLGGVQELTVIGMVQMVALLAGFLFSGIVIQRAAMRLYRRRAPLGLLPWVLLVLGLMLAAVWIFSLPMEMRGNVVFG